MELPGTNKKKAPNVRTGGPPPPKIKNYQGGQTPHPDYFPSVKKQRRNVLAGIGMLLFIAALFSGFDVARGFPFWFAIVFVLDVVYLGARIAKKKVLGLPKLFILYLPFTTIWLAAVVVPGHLEVVWGPVAWHLWLAFVLLASLYILASRVINDAVEYGLFDARNDRKTAVQIAEAKESGAYLDGGIYLIDRPKKNLTKRYDQETFPKRFDSAVAALIDWRLSSCFLFSSGPGVLVLLAVLSIVAEPPDVKVDAVTINAALWPLMAVFSVAGFIFNLQCRSVRKQWANTAWAVQLLFNNMGQTKAEAASWTRVSPYGYRHDRRAYLFFKFALIYVVLAQLCFSRGLAVGPPGSYLEYPNSGTQMLVMQVLEAGSWSYGLKRAALYFVGVFCLAPLLAFSMLVSLCGEQLDRVHRLFLADNALAHRSQQVAVNGNAQNQPHAELVTT